jgi:hypothetical protein
MTNINSLSAIIFVLGLGVIQASSVQGATLDTSKATISGLVIDAATKNPIPRVTLFLNYQPFAGPITEPVSQTSALDGSFQFSNVEPGDSLISYTISACDSVYYCKSITFHGLLAGQNKTIEISMEKDIIIFVHTESMANPVTLGMAHISIITPKRERDLPQWWLRTIVTLSDSTGWGLLGSPNQGKTINASLGGTIQVCVSKEGFKTQIVSETLSANSWEDTLTVTLVPDTAGISQTLRGSVVDQYGSSDGLAVMFLGMVEGNPFVQFDYAQGNKFKIEGIPDTISSGVLYVMGDSLNIVKADFSRNLSLTSHRPITTAIRVSRNENEKDRKNGPQPSRIDLGKSGRRVTNLLGQDISDINLGINREKQQNVSGIFLIPGR